MTFRDVMRGWALTHRDRAIERVQAARASFSNWERLGVGRGTLEAERGRVRRAERSLVFWEDLYGRLS